MLRKISTFLFLLLALVGCSSQIHTVAVESLNADLSGYDIDNSYLQQIDANTVHQIMDEKASAVIFFSRPTCPWCQICMPVFYQAVLEKGEGLPIYYYDVTLENEQELQTLIDVANRFDNILEKDASGKVRFFVPNCISIVNGKAKAQHVATVKDHTDSNVNLTSEQIDTLKQCYFDLFDMVRQK